MAKAKKERKEDLNPRTDDIEERVKRMMDLSIPDEPTLPSETTTAPATQQPVTIQAVSTPATPESVVEAAPSAPVLPAKQETKPEKTPQTKGKKINVISHHGQEVTKTEVPATAPSVTKIAITEHGAGAEDVAEKLDEAIAGLDDAKPVEPVHDVSWANPSATVEFREDAIDEPIEEAPMVASPETDKAVEEIVAEESDELLEAEDTIRGSDDVAESESKSSIGVFLLVIVFLVLASFAVLMAIPKTRDAIRSWINENTSLPYKI